MLFPVLTIDDYFTPTIEAAGIYGFVVGAKYVKTVEPISPPQRLGRCVAAVVHLRHRRRQARKQSWACTWRAASA